MTGVFSDSRSKKRKHRHTGDPDRTSNMSQKKREKRHKATALEDASSSPKSKPKSPHNKGKSRTLDHPSEFHMINTSLVLSIPPVFASDLRAGVEEMLDSMVMRYIPSLQGVLLAHSNICFLCQTASIHGDCPFAVCNVRFDATVWGPRVAMKLVGRISLCSPDHISLLVHRTFNVSIPRHHIPQDQWSFEYGQAENDPEFGEGRAWDTSGTYQGTADGEGDAEMNGSDSAGPQAGETQGTEGSGWWVHHLTGSKLGDPDGYVEFTVIGLTVANEMLSLQGSIQPDPFSPDHVPHPDKRSASPAFLQDETSEVEVHVERDEEEGEEDEEDESDEDGFKYLAMLTDAAQAAQKTKRAKEVERLEKAKKRKRREGGGVVGEEDPHHGKRAERKRIKETTS